MDVLRLHKLLEKAGIPVISVFGEGKIEFESTVTEEQKLQAQDIIRNFDPESKTEPELAKIEFESVPYWAMWTSQEASDFILNQIFNGQTKEQIDSWIDSNVSTIAQSKVALKTLAGEILKIRADLAKIAQLIILIRNVTIRN